MAHYRLSHLDLSTRIALVLELLGIGRSVGYISQTLNAAGAQATAQNQALVVPVPILGEADEIFQGRKPCLTLVDGCLFLVLNLTPADSRDATTWGVMYLDLLERGIRFHDLASPAVCKPSSLNQRVKWPVPQPTSSRLLAWGKRANICLERAFSRRSARRPAVSYQAS
jgi:hypothetical protein